MATHAELEKQLNHWKAEFLEFKQAVENTFRASEIGLGVEFGRQLHLLREKNALAQTADAPPPLLPPTISAVDEAAVLRAIVTEMLVEARATMPLPPLDQAIKIAKGDVV